jgi:hypothetical protein
MHLWEDNIKIDPREVTCEDLKCIDKVWDFSEQIDSLDVL